MPAGGSAAPLTLPAQSSFGVDTKSDPNTFRPAGRRRHLAVRRVVLFAKVGTRIVDGRLPRREARGLRRPGCSGRGRQVPECARTALPSWRLPRTAGCSLGRPRWDEHLFVAHTVRRELTPFPNTPPVAADMKLPGGSEIAEGPYFLFVYTAGMILTGTRPALKVSRRKAHRAAPPSLFRPRVGPPCLPSPTTLARLQQRVICQTSLRSAHGGLGSTFAQQRRFPR